MAAQALLVKVKDIGRRKMVGAQEVGSTRPKAAFVAVGISLCGQVGYFSSGQRRSESRGAGEFRFEIATRILIFGHISKALG